MMCDDLDTHNPLQYMKASAIPFLHAAIGEPIKEIFESKSIFEVRPQIVTLLLRS